jgi:uncharacterized MnhB-related membrane protein
MTVFRDVLLVLIAIAGGAMALAGPPKRQLMIFGVFGGLLTLFFFALQAPDVALAQLAVGAVAYPLMVLLALARAEGVQELPTRVPSHSEEQEEEEDR